LLSCFPDFGNSSHFFFSPAALDFYRIFKPATLRASRITRCLSEGKSTEDIFVQLSQSSHPKEKGDKFMTASAKPVPEGFHTVTPSLVVRDAAKAIEFYKKALGAQELSRMPGPDGKIMHAELKIGDSVVFIADENPQMVNIKSPQTLGGCTGSLNIYVPNVDELFKQAIAAGEKILADAGYYK
jgi:uncharacterized glyoxalase superfamily protein PhnB